ncbi:MAG: hypothetical protein GY799_30520 [Desulfobulbaceae bacterium]|nr:hypothetical protein [Desulfobulbaceae bacterium]
MKKTDPKHYRSFFYLIKIFLFLICIAVTTYADTTNFDGSQLINVGHCQIYYSPQLAAEPFVIDELNVSETESISWDGSCQNGLAHGQGVLNIKIGDRQYLDFSGIVENGVFNDKVELGVYYQPPTSSIRTGKDWVRWVSGKNIFDTESAYELYLLSLKAEPVYQQLRAGNTNVSEYLKFIEQFKGTEQEQKAQRVLLEKSKDSITDLQHIINHSATDFVQKEAAVERLFKLIEEKYNISLLTSFQENKAGTRYVPTVSNTFYSSENESYYVNGEYVSKYRPKSETITSGGFDESVYQQDLLFALDNHSDEVYSLVFEAIWTATEFYWEEEEYCHEMGFFSCSEQGKRNVKRERGIGKRHRQSFLIPPDGRVKHKIKMGERVPTDLVYTLSEVTTIPKDLFNRYAQVMEKADEETLLGLQLLIREPQLAKFNDELSHRGKVIKSKLAEQFSSTYLEDAKLEVVVRKNYDPDFNNQITLSAITAGQPMIVVVKTPAGEFEFKADEQVNGFKISDTCIRCKYKGTLVIPNIRGIRKEKLLDQSKVIDVIKLAS